MHLKILPDSTLILNQYANHSTFHDGDSGLDLFFTEDTVIEANKTKFISLGIKCEAFPSKAKEHNISYYLYPRSSISKTPLRMANSVGIIDAGYRGTLIVAVDNISNEAYTVSVGQRLFQLCSPDLSPITFEITDNLSTTSRGEGNFGSTNV
mgnify:CR=1 FL=1